MARAALFAFFMVVIVGFSVITDAPGATTAESPRGEVAPIKHRDPVIIRVIFRGRPSNPEIVIRGKHFGQRPSADPPHGTSNLGLCGPIPGDTGKDYGGKLWLEDRTQHWSAGYAPFVDCIGLIVKKYTDREIVYRLGSLYRIAYGEPNPLGGVYKLAKGDTVNVTVNGTVFTTRVRYARPDERGAEHGEHRR